MNEYRLKFPGGSDCQASKVVTSDAPRDWQWNFDDPFSGNNFSSEENPSHTFSNPGFYNVFLSALISDGMGGACFVWIRKPVPVPAAADFTTSP